MSIDFYKALEISGIGLVGVFLFMTIFFFVIKWIDRLFPHKKDEDDNK